MQHEQAPTATTLGELKASGYKSRPIKAELRHNLINKIKSGEPILPGVMGYEDTVVPALTNAILGNQDIIFLGERGQAKSRIVRSLVSLMDPFIPTLKDTEIPDDPLAPISPMGKKIVAEQGDASAIRWLTPDERYAEKLATPDITIADLIGEIDPIKVAEGRYLSDEMTVHYGLVPRVNRGIFAINELPDLAERIQVGMLNLLEERDIQIRGHKIRLPLDVFIIATANPEDYTNRGRIITPLKDRYGAQIRTHYPRKIDQEIAIMQQEANIGDLEGCRLNVPAFMQEIVAQITHHARRSPDINQRSGVSVRTSIANYEALVANAFRRVLKLGETEVTPRISDVAHLLPSLQGKVEFEASVGNMEDDQDDKITNRIFNAAIKCVFDQHYDTNDLESVIAYFNDSQSIDIGDMASLEDYLDIIKNIPALAATFAHKGTDNNPPSLAEQASYIELILEGLHQHQLLNKQQISGQASYSA